MTSRPPKFLYRSLFDHTFDGVAYCQMLFDTRGRPVDFLLKEVNRNFEQVLGLKRAVGKRATKLIPGVARTNPELLEIFGRVALTGKPERFEIHVQRLKRWFFVSVYCPQKRSFVAIFQNITKRKLDEVKLANAKIAAQNVFEDLGSEYSTVMRSAAKQRAILLAIGDGLLATDARGIITLVNATSQKLLKKKSREMIGKYISDVIQIVDDQGKPIQWKELPVRKALSLGKATVDTPASPNFYYVRKNKTKFPVAITLTPVKLGGKLIGTIQIFRDITKEKAVDRAKTELISLASHQLRTPLSIVKWYTEMLLSGDVGTPNEAQKKYLNVVSKGNQRMVDLVNALLNVSRMELGTLSITPEPVDAVPLVRSVVGEYEFPIAEKKLILKQNLADHLPPISADPKILRIVFQNLMSNAVKYSRYGGTIQLALSSFEKNNLLFTVADTGLGIPADQQDRIFTKLFRADNVKAQDTQGTGLGLYLVKLIVDQLGGKIWFKSKEKKGTTFFVQLPFSGMKKQEGTKKLV